MINELIQEGKSLLEYNADEPVESLSPAAADMHRALASMQEEITAIDVYQQRIDAVTDKELKQLLIHNRDEEKDHAAKLLEWVRHQDTAMAAKLKENLFKTKVKED